MIQVASSQLGLAHPGYWYLKVSPRTQGRSIQVRGLDDLPCLHRSLGRSRRYPFSDVNRLRPAVQDCPPEYMGMPHHCSYLLWLRPRRLVRHHDLRLHPPRIRISSAAPSITFVSSATILDAPLSLLIHPQGPRLPGSMSRRAGRKMQTTISISSPKTFFGPAVPAFSLFPDSSPLVPHPRGQYRCSICSQHPPAYRRWSDRHGLIGQPALTRCSALDRASNRNLSP